MIRLVTQLENVVDFNILKLISCRHRIETITEVSLRCIMRHHFCIAHVVLRIRIRFTCSEDGGGDCHSFVTTRIM